MSRRLPAPAPILPGYTVLRPLGSGGFADVHLYEQAMPRRKVAVKVLLDATGADARAMFLAEATVLAQLSSHPSVLTVYEANIAADGRPYLVMEYCPDSFGNRYRNERMPLADVLETAVAIGGVLETSHRSGLLHRDVKPANILITAYGRPVLADFGIAATLAAAELNEATGLSVPWAAPEVLRGESRGDVRSEVWSFAATVYTLLAGRSPFEVPDRDNSRDAVGRRIVGRDRVRPVGRADVPASLEAVLVQALEKDPAKRPATILDVLRRIQLAEGELGLRPSALEIATERVIDVGELRTPSFTRAPRSPHARSRHRRRPGKRTDATVSRSTSMSEDASATVLDVRQRAESVSRRRIGLIAGISVPVVGALLGAAVLVISAGVRDGSAPMVADLHATTDAEVVEFSWSAADSADDDDYLVRVDDAPGRTQQKTSIVVDRAAAGSRVCVTVAVVRNGRPGPASAPVCVRE